MIKRIIPICLASFVLVQCQKESTTILSEPNELREDFIRNNSNIFVYNDAHSSFVIQTIEGSHISFPKNSFLKNGINFSGEVRVEFSLVYKRSEMIMAALPTIYYSENEGSVPLNSGGAFQVRAFDNKDNSELTLQKSFTFSIPSRLTDNLYEPMQLFELNEDRLSSWSDISGDTIETNQVWNSEVNFRGRANQFKWYNVDAKLSFDGPTAPLRYLHSIGKDYLSSLTFIGVECLPNSVLDTRIELPIDSNCVLISYSLKDDNYYYKFHKFSMKEGLEIDLSQEKIQKASREEFEVELDKILSFQ